MFCVVCILKAGGYFYITDRVPDEYLLIGIHSLSALFYMVMIKPKTFRTTRKITIFEARKKYIDLKKQNSRDKKKRQKKK